MVDAAGVVGRGHRAAARGSGIIWVGSHGVRSADVRAATEASIAGIAGALDAEGSRIEELVRLGVHHDQSLDDATVRRAVRAALPESARPVVSFLPVREASLAGAVLVIDGAAASGPRHEVGGGNFPSAVRVGDRVWTGGTRGVGDGILTQTADVIARLTSVAEEAGMALDDCVKVNIAYVGTGRRRCHGRRTGLAAREG